MSVLLLICFPLPIKTLSKPLLTPSTPRRTFLLLSPLLPTILPLAFSGSASASESSSVEGARFASATFANGSIRLDDPLLTFEATLGKLTNPTLLGSGGGGAVYAFDRDRDGTQASSSRVAVKSSRVAVKVSWVRSSSSVANECKILEHMESRQVSGVERCLARSPYALDDRRTVIVVSPVADDAAASVTAIDEKLRPNAVRCIVRTMVQMLASGAVTADVQPLISTATGDVLFIDMTEAKIIREARGGGVAFLDLALAASFCSEMLVLIPDELRGVASEALLEELSAAAAKSDGGRGGAGMGVQLLEIVRDQVAAFATGDLLERIDAILAA